MEQQKFMYSVRPRKPIVGLESVDFIRVAKSLELTKPDVLICLDKASVYRRFSNGHEEKVTKLNIDRLHNDKFMTEEEFAKFGKDKLSEGAQKVVDTTPAKKVEEPVKEVVEEEIKEDSAVEELKEEVVESEAEATEEKVEEVADATDSTEGNTESESSEEISDDKDDVKEEVEEQNSLKNFTESNNHHKKNKR